MTDKLILTNEDNMALMARYPDKFYDLAICDAILKVINNRIR